MASLPLLALDGAPIFTRIQRLTASQWKRSLLDILRLEPSTQVAKELAKPAGRAGGFSNNERLLFVDLMAELAVEESSEAAATLATDSAGGLSRLGAGSDPAAFVRTVGRRAFRRPLTSDEELRYQGLFALGEKVYGVGFSNGAGLVVRAMLQSPMFLYRSELGATSEPLNGYEVASKLSFWLLGTTPSDDLLDAAAAGALDSPDGLEKVAAAMLEQAAGVAVMRDFHAQLHHRDSFDSLDATSASPGLRAEMIDAADRFFDASFTSNEGLRAILTSQRGFVGPALASLYGITPAPSAVEERVLGAARLGYFMQVPFLLSHGVGSDADPIGRGAAIAQDVLCLGLPGHTIPKPVLPPAMPGQTKRTRIDLATASCGAACHTNYINPLGFALEAFDGLGRPRTIDNGSPVMTSATFPLTSGLRQFANASELVTSLASDPRAHACYAKNIMSYALQRDLIESDRAQVDVLATISNTQSVKRMILALVRSPAFRIRSEGKP